MYHWNVLSYTIFYEFFFSWYGFIILKAYSFHINLVSGLKRVGIRGNEKFCHWQMEYLPVSLQLDAMQIIIQPSFNHHASNHVLHN